MTDWNLIIQGNISLLWIQECLKPENENKTIKDLLNEYRLKNENVTILNPGCLFMAAYLLFLYPKESEIVSTNLSFINTGIFDIITMGVKSPDESKEEYIVRRIRNSLAHGNFEIDDNLVITFEDNNSAKTNLFRTKIRFNQFGELINNFMQESKNTRYNK
ncbi:hypothetical protein [Myroides profundi]|uniref:pEK499-p136 HEPN domain-containing protein n=1 Tax=Myroides profundi TaxID=480520 RepID=A0AAJ4W194_MYRPR|nr:hypothetical protein [Myroides profundi]AJH13659.1 hypothetical protein MPR_0448 [Myroides profundi]SEP90012.1 hypothetical protein SAMN04488089_10142 [Myroides profundi]